MKRDTSKDEERIQLQVDLSDLLHERYGVESTGGNLDDDGGVEISLAWEASAKMLGDLRKIVPPPTIGSHRMAHGAGAAAERERLRPLLERLLAHLTGADRGEKCSAVIGHGPGHQSSTTCEVRGPHTIHCATYGSADEVARWEGDGETFTGHFDEPPAEDDALVAKWFDEQTARGALRETLLADLRRELGKEPIDV